MELWLDTCDESTIKLAQKLGLLYGITTNPLILAKASSSPINTLKKLLDLHPGPITAQVTATTSQEMLKQAHKLHALSPRLVIKVPASLEGLITIHHLAQENICVMATILYDSLQALYAFKAGASYGALYIGRMEDQHLNPLAMIDTIHHHNPSYKMIAASLRSKEHIINCLQRGCAITIKEDLFKALLETHPLTLANMQAFSHALPSNWI